MQDVLGIVYSVLYHQDHDYQTNILRKMTITSEYELTDAVALLGLLAPETLVAPIMPLTF